MDATRPGTGQHAQSGISCNALKPYRRGWPAVWPPVGPGRDSRTRLVISRAGPDSIDDEDGSVDSLTRELREYVSEETHTTNKEHLDLLFEISASALTKNRQVSESAREECTRCHGTGEIECPYCNGTGALTVGDVLFCDHSGCKKCVVCRNGQLKCNTCNGCGRYARWMLRPT